MNSKLLILLVIVLLVTGWRFGIAPLFEEIDILQASLDDQEKMVAQKEAERDRLQSYKKQLSALTSEKERLKVILPQEPEKEKLLVEMDKLLTKAGVHTSNISISEQRQKSKEQNANVKQLLIKLNIRDSYSSLKQFIMLVQRELRLMDIQSIQFSSRRQREEAQGIPLYDFQVDINTYYY
jgi:Tfp pilus assembly protein PilO